MKKMNKMKSSSPAKSSGGLEKMNKSAPKSSKKSTKSMGKKGCM